MRYQKSIESGCPIGCWELGGWWKNHVFGVRKKPRLTLSYDVRAQVRLRERWVVKVRPRTWKLSRVLCIVKFLANQLCIIWVVTSSYIVLTRQLTCIFLGKSSGVSSSEQGKHVTLALRTDAELWKERLYSCVMTWFVHFPTQCVKGKKRFSTCLLRPSKNISLSYNVYSHIMKRNEKIQATRGAATGKARNTALVG